ncbi:membrane bound O-acyl transferase family-domain-containing protein [Podospora conica]|nr:membrane bound O-acyl transferase family-domain-containing protein [Schizothecium conicum]
MLAKLYPPTNLPTYYRDLYRSQYHADLANGTVRPLTIPYSLLGCLLPVFYLTIPHRRRPWLYRSRFLVVLAMILFNIDVVFWRRTSSANFAGSYATGLTCAWGTIWGITLLLVMNVQGGVARIAMRRQTDPNRDYVKEVAYVPDESIRTAIKQGWEYYWQPYPEDAPFTTRLGWVWNLYTSFRGAGWSFAIPTIPHPPPPTNISSSPPVVFTPSSFRPHPTGSSISPTHSSFIRSRLFDIFWTYLALDLWTVTARYDTYFVPGPGVSLPPANIPIPPSLVPFSHTLLSALGILSALIHYLSLFQLLSYLLTRPPHRQLHQYPSPFGSLLALPRRGLPGVWSSFWHQSFRLGFTFPTFLLPSSLPRHHPLRTITTTLSAFLLSGLLHAAGGFTCPAGPVAAKTQWWMPVGFFLAQFVGVTVQAVGAWVVPRRVGRGVRGVGNTLFALGWLHVTNWMLIGDFSRAGLWLFEPLPVSVVRLVGWGPEGEGWWRWDGSFLPGWTAGMGGRWWEGGVRL